MIQKSFSDISNEIDNIDQNLLILSNKINRHRDRRSNLSLYRECDILLDKRLVLMDQRSIVVEELEKLVEIT